MLEAKYGKHNIQFKDVLSHALYPKVFEEWQDFRLIFGDVAELPTTLFLHPMKQGQETELIIEEGRELLVKMVSIGDADESGTRQVIFELNGERWFVPVTDKSSKQASTGSTFRPKAPDGFLGIVEAIVCSHIPTAILMG